MTSQGLQTLYTNSLGIAPDGSPLLAMNLSDVDTVLPVVQLYLPDNTLRVKNPTSQILDIGVSGPNDPGTFRISGIGVDSPYNDMHITIDFVFEGSNYDETYFTITGTIDNVNSEKWTLDYGFPAFIGTVFNEVPFSSGTCYLYTKATTYDGQQLSAGMYISGTIDLAAMSGGFSTLLGAGSQQVEGYVDMVSNGSIINDLLLDGVQSIGVNIAVATLNKVGVTLSYDVVEDPSDSSAYALPFFQVAGEFDFWSEGVKYEIPVYMRAANTANLRFEADITNAIQAGVAALTTLTNTLDIRSFLPTNFSLDTLVQLTSIYAIFDSTQNTISNVGIEIKNRTPFVLADIGLSHKTLRLDNIVLNLMVSSPLSNPQGVAAASANIILQDIGALELSVVFPDLSFTASIPANTDIMVSDFINLLLGSECGLPDFVINDFDLTVTKQPEANVFDYDLSLNVLDTWWIGPSFLCVENFSLILTSNPRYFALAGGMFVAKILLELEAEYTGQDGEWIFRGGTLEGFPPISVGELVEQLAYYFTTDADVPTFISSMAITNIGTTFSTLTHDFTFHLEIHDVLVEGGPTVDITVDIDILKQNDGTYRKTFTGQLFLNTGVVQDSQPVKLAFDLVFSVDVGEYVMLATYTNLNGSYIDVTSLVSSLLAPDHIPAIINSDDFHLTFTLKDALFAWYAPDKTLGNSKVLFVLDMEDGINLSGLPLVGAQFPTNQTAKLAYKVMVASQDFLVSDLLFFNNLLPASSAKFPPVGTNPDGSIPANTDVQVTQGLSLSTTFQLGPVHQTLNLPVGLNPNSGQLQSANSTTPLPVQPIWYNVQKTFGPVYFGRIGMQYDDDSIHFYLDASLDAGGLSLDLDGLSVSTRLTELTPSFDIKGIAVDFSEGGLEINGALLRQSIQGNDVYNGTATIKLEDFGIAVLGSYSYYDDHPSLFLYGVLSAPMGGIPAFFVTGLSAGFGYNRDLVLPSLAQLDQFPLVAEAMGVTQSAATLDAEMNRLSNYIPPSIGEYWAAAGVKFTTYKVVDSFALLTVAAGNHLSLNLMGISTAVAPPQVTGNAVLAEIQMAFLASIDLTLGFVGFSADLTNNSFILSRDARLTGGFAFYAWYAGDHAMDFVLTAGGYNPKFSRPGHYPVVPRLGLNWQIDSKLSIKGQLYFALTPGMMMAGGSLEMTWVDDHIRVWFSASIDLIVGWKPFTYSASTNIQVGASYKGHFGHTHSLSAKAALDIWGPDFSGSATIDLVLTSVTVKFGKSKKQKATAIGWGDFRDSFIPENALTFSVSKGLIASNSSGFVVNQCDVEVLLDSILPVSDLIGSEANYWGKIAGIAPMGIHSHDLTITMQLTGVDTALFDIIPVYKNVPAALWGSPPSTSTSTIGLIQVTTPKLTDNPLASDVVGGFVIKPKPVIRPDATLSFPLNRIGYYLETTPGVVHWEDDLSIAGTASELETLNQQIVDEAVAQNRQNLMAAMNSHAEINLTSDWANMFIELPKTMV